MEPMIVTAEELRSLVEDGGYNPVHSFECTDGYYYIELERDGWHEIVKQAVKVNPCETCNRDDCPTMFNNYARETGECPRQDA